MRSRLTRIHRGIASMLTRSAMGREEISKAPVKIAVTFRPPDKRRRDKSNMIAAFKSFEDGISDAIGIDDTHFEISYSIGGIDRPLGSVSVVIGGDA